MLGSGLGPDRLGAYSTVGTVLVLQSLFYRDYNIDILDHCLHFGVLGMRNAQALVQSMGFMLKPYFQRNTILNPHPITSMKPKPSMRCDTDAEPAFFITDYLVHKLKKKGFLNGQNDSSPPKPYIVPILPLYKPI